MDVIQYPLNKLLAVAAAGLLRARWNASLGHEPGRADFSATEDGLVGQDARCTPKAFGAGCVLTGFVESLPGFECGLQIVDDEPCQPHRVTEGCIVGTGSWRCLLHRERYRTKAKDFDTGAVVG
jgi:hypothetical protein